MWAGGCWPLGKTERDPGDHQGGVGIILGRRVRGRRLMMPGNFSNKARHESPSETLESSHPSPSHTTQHPFCPPRPRSCRTLLIFAIGLGQHGLLWPGLNHSMCPFCLHSCPTTTHPPHRAGLLKCWLPVNIPCLCWKPSNGFSSACHSSPSRQGLNPMLPPILVRRWAPSGTSLPRFPQL